MKYTLALVLMVFGIVGCGVAQFPAYMSDPYSEQQTKFWGRATDSLYKRSNTSNQERLSEFRSCKRDVTLINKTDWQKGNALNECMVALGYRPIGLASTHWEWQQKFDLDY